MDKLKLTLGDSIERVKWRTKQNLDFVFLMTYAQPKGTFYVQLEDDILAKHNFITTMKNYAIEITAKKQNWFVLDFCQLGFIGKMFKSAELPWAITFFQMFYNDKPVDWLLNYLIVTKICNQDKDSVRLYYFRFCTITFFGIENKFYCFYRNNASKISHNYGCITNRHYFNI